MDLSNGLLSRELLSFELDAPEFPPVNASIARKTVVVVGGGISGLAAAHRLTELDRELNIVVLEAGARVGGVLQTVRRDGFLIEQSADNFITNVPWAVDLCRRIGLGEQLIATRTEQRGALVVHRGKLVRVPEGFVLLASARLWPLVTTPILSPLGKLRLLAERFVPRRVKSGDESLAAFARRRLGREVFPGGSGRTRFCRKPRERCSLRAIHYPRRRTRHARRAVGRTHTGRQPAAQ
jgi:hypothetical protein